MLVEDWANVPGREKTRCVLSADYLAGYVKCLTCPEMERAIEEYADNTSMSGPLVCFQAKVESQLMRLLGNIPKFNIKPLKPQPQFNG
jgi:hypothetical protein